MACVSCKSEKTEGENPFFSAWETPYGVPPFDKIRAEHFLPALERGMSLHDAEIDAIASNNDDPTFGNVIEAYDAAFRPLGVQTLEHYNAEHESSGHLYMTHVPNITPEQRNEIIIKMAEQGVACNVHYKPLPMHTAYRKLGFDIADYPHAYAHFANEITLPLHTRLTDEDVAYVIEKYVEILKEYI